MSPTFLREVTRTAAVSVAIAVCQPLLVRWIGPFSEHPERALAVLLPLGLVIAVLGWPAYRDRRVLLGGGFVAFFVGFCLLFSIAAGSDLLSGRRTPLVGYEEAVPRNFLGLNWLGDWRYALLPPMPRAGTDTLVFTLDPAADRSARRREFAALIQLAVANRARGIAFDFYFADSSVVDPLLCTVVQRATAAGLPVYFGYLHRERGGILEHAPLPSSLDCLHGRLASLAGYREADGRVRMVPLYLQHDPNDESLSLKIARHLATGTLGLPAGGLVQFTRPARDREPIRGMPTKEQWPAFENRFVLVGSSRAGDVHDTPYGLVPGVKIHELAALSLSQARWIERLAPGWSFPLIFAFCFLLIVVQARGSGTRRLIAVALTLVGATVLLASAAIRWALVWIDVSYVVAAVGSLTGLLLAGSGVQRQRREREVIVRAALGDAPADAAPGRRIFDVFLSHHSTDDAVTRDLADALRTRGLEVWFDEWELVPGRPWQEAIEEAIQTVRTAVVLVGPEGVGPWERTEMRACLDQAVRRSMPVIPVLLPGVMTAPALPPFLEGFTWVDLRGGLDEPGLDRLEWGITGVKPGRHREAVR